MDFKITLHSGVPTPPDALDLLSRRLGSQRDEVSFTRLGEVIRARTSQDAPISMTRDERAELGRRLVLGIVRDTCEGVDELQWSWFAVGSDE